jgi:ABC-type antimicrobial peptide transport system permease subunit
MPSNILVFNERVKLLASAVNLVAIGMMAIGVTTPLVSASYSGHVISIIGAVGSATPIFFWFVLACVVHLVAHMTLGRLIP